MLLTLIMLAPYSASIATALKLYADPTFDTDAGKKELTKAQKRRRWWQKNWIKAAIAAIQIAKNV